MIPLNQNLNALKRSQIRVFTNLAKATPGCASLTIGEPDLDTPENIKQAAVASLNANQTHYDVGKEVRETIERLGGTMPEDLPTPTKSIKQIEREQKKLN